jgi:AcrR family transcriptional regulator
MKKRSPRQEKTWQSFIHAAKEIIDKEGIEGVSARKIGELSGYSYATIYNYFKDLKELLAYCAYDLLRDCSLKMRSLKTEGLTWLQILHHYNEVYFRYFTDHPDYFYLVFVQDYGDYTLEISKEEDPLHVGMILHEHLLKGLNRGYIHESQIPMIESILSAAIHGKLLFYISKRHGQDLEDLLEDLRNEVEYVIGGKSEF